MDTFSRTTTVVFLSFMVFGMAGCDLFDFSSKKVVYSPKEDKTEVSVPAAAMPAAASVVGPEEKAPGKLPDDVLAKVGDWTLTVKEFDDRVQGIKQVVKDFDEKNAESQRMVLEELVRQRILVYQAKLEKIDEKQEVKDAVADFENTLLVQDLVGKLTEGVEVTEREAKDYYDANPDQFIRGVEKKVREIVVSTEAEAKDILVQTLQGADFAAMATERSTGASAAKGGDLGFVFQAPFEQMQKAIDALEKNGISAVFQGPEGYYIVKVEDVRGGDKVSFDEVKDELMRGLTMQKQQQAVLDQLAETSKKVDVQINVDLFNTRTGE